MDKEQDQEINQDQEQSQSNEELKASIREEVMGELKSQIDGLNRRVGEITKERDTIAAEAKKEAEAKLTVSERLEKMENELKTSREESAREKLKSIMTVKATKMLEEANLPLSIIDKIKLESDETILADIEFYSELFSGYEQTAKDEIRKKNRFIPSGGDAKHSVPKSLADCKTQDEKVAYLQSKR